MKDVVVAEHDRAVEAYDQAVAAAHTCGELAAAVRSSRRALDAWETCQWLADSLAWATGTPSAAVVLAPEPVSETFQAPPGFKRNDVVLIRGLQVVDHFFGYAPPEAVEWWLRYAPPPAPAALARVGCVHVFAPMAWDNFLDARNVHVLLRNAHAMKATVRTQHKAATDGLLRAVTDVQWGAECARDAYARPGVPGCWSAHYLGSPSQRGQTNLERFQFLVREWSTCTWNVDSLTWAREGFDRGEVGGSSVAAHFFDDAPTYTHEWWGWRHAPAGARFDG
jgi:hypothetical protein